MTLENKESVGTGLSTFNISGYRFFPLENPEKYQALIKEKCLKLGIMGSVIVSPEGTNIMMAGPKEKIEIFRLFLQEELNFPPIEFRESWSREIPYNRLLIKVKKTIVAGEQYRFNQENGTPLQPEEFKKWLDEGKEMTVIDVRNDYENRVGAFECSREFGSYNFNEFPEIAQRELGHLDREKPIVSICTGGIKTEKASMVLKDMGFQQVYYLQGGIIKYFEKCGKEHYRGDCFVFDKRVAIDAQLKETGTTMCYNCRAPVTPDEQKSEQYIEEVVCPHCHQRKEQEKVSLKRRLEKQADCDHLC